MSRARRTVAIALLGAGLLVNTGCDEQVASQWTTLSGDYLGNVVSALVVRGLQNALGIDAADSQAGDEHAHDTGALHEHEH